MRKSVVILAVFLFSVSMFAGVTKSEFVGGMKYFYDFDAGEPSHEMTFVNIPSVDYKLEMMLGKLFKIYVHPSIGYKLYKETFDGEPEEGHDRYATEFYFGVKPMLKFYLPKSILKMEGFFAKGGLPIYFGSISPQVELGEEGYEAVHIRTIDIFMNLGFDNRKIDQHLLTPWDSFEQGWAAYATYDEHLIKIETGVDESVPTLRELRYFGISGCYSHLVKKENMMVKMGLNLKHQMSDSGFGGGHKDTTIDLNLLFAYDVIKEVHASANFGFRAEELEMTDEFGNGNYNYLVFGANGHYYPLPIFDLYGGFELNMDLTSTDAEPSYKFELGGALMFK